MEIDPEALDSWKKYQLLLSAVVPRPIAFVTTKSPAGVVNLAPFSFFNAVSSDPPVVMLSIGRRDGERKDTSRNILETGDFVVNASTADLAPQINRAAGDWPAHVSEAELLGLELLPSTVVRPPRLAASPVNLECVLVHALELEELPSTVIFGRIVRFHIREDVLAVDGKIDAEKLRPIARLSGDLYAHLGALFAQKRPRVDRRTGEEQA